MMLRVLLLVMLAQSVAGAGIQQQTRATVLTLPPAAFSDLATEIRRYLEARACRVPQSYVSKAPHNIIIGHFFSPSQVDTAVLCWSRGRERLLVFRGNSVQRPITLSEGATGGYMQDIDGLGTLGYSHVLGVATRDHILGDHEAFGGPTPPRIDHDGIEDGFAEKASSIWYWYRGRWLSLKGAD